MQVTVGLRPGDAYGLCWDAVDLESSTITIRRAVRNEENTAVLVDRRETRHAHRAVVLPAEAARMHAEHSRRQDVERLASNNWAATRLVFATRAGTPLSARNVRRELDRIEFEADLPSATPNDPRHAVRPSIDAADSAVDRLIAENA